MRRFLATLAVAAIFFGLAAGAVQAGPESLEQRGLAPQAAVPVVLGEAGWSDPAVGTWDLNTRTATLTTDLARPIRVDANSLTLDGAAHTLTGSGSGNGVELTGRMGVTISNTAVTNFSYGFYLSGCTSSALTGNTASGNDYGFYLASGSGFVTLTNNRADGNRYNGVHLQDSSLNTLVDNAADSNAGDGICLVTSGLSTLTGNTANQNQKCGLRLDASGKSTLSRNTMSQNRYNFSVSGAAEGDYYGQKIDTSNLVDGKPIYYLQDATGQTIDGASNAGTVYLLRCTGMTVRGLTLSKNETGLFLWGTRNSTIENVEASNNNAGIRLCGSSSGNTLKGNTTSSNTRHGIWLKSSGTNTLTENSANGNGLYGLFLEGANSNTLTKNNVSDNQYGAYLATASSNKVYINRFINNKANPTNKQAYISGGSGNTFSEPAPTGGNFWSDWTGPDANRDGFVDSSYVFTGGRDDLPFAEQSGSIDTTPPVTTIALQGTPGANGWYLSDVRVTLSAQDNPGGSGVATIQYSFDGTNWSSYSAPFTISSEGTTTVYYRSIDNAGNVEQPGSETALLFDDFATFDPNRWVDASFLPSYAGRPDSISQAGMDGRSTMLMQSAVAATSQNKRKGIVSATAIAATPEMAVEVPFKPVGDIDGLAELWLFSQDRTRYVQVGAWVGYNGGNAFVTTAVSGQGTRYSPTSIFSLGEWLFFRIETVPGMPTRTHISLLDANRAVRWLTTYDFALSDLGSFNVALSQQLGAPSGPNANWWMKAYFDYVKVSRVDRATRCERVSVDKTPPTVAFGTPSPAANSAGWNNTDVSIPFTAADDVSGVAGTMPAASPLVLTEEGANVSLTVAVTDVAGNSASYPSPAANIDKTPPTLTAVATTSSGGEYTPGSWTNAEYVTVQWSATDNVSGVNDADVPPSSTISEECTDAVVGPVSVTDRAGNTATASFGSINIDRTPPTLEFGQPTPPANAMGWHTDIVSVPFTAADDRSGVASTEPASNPLVLTEEGENVSATVTVTDLAGNSVTGTFGPLKIDRTPPTVEFGAPTPAANGAGWNNSDVSIPFSVSDNVSGVASSSPESPLVLTEEGLEVTGTVTVTDVAGNSASVASPAVRIDKTAPTITVVATTASGREYAAGSWANEDVTVSFTCSDELSGPANELVPVAVSQEGSNWAVSGACTDFAGNTATVTFGPIMIDKTPPVIGFGTPAPAANAAGWYNSDVSVPFTIEENLSGVAACEPPASPLVLAQEGWEVTGTVTVTDAAGNSASKTFGPVHIDRTPPTVTVAATTASGLEYTAGTWTTEQSVTVSFGCSDELSGLANDLAPVTVSDEGADWTVAGTCSDLAGNSTNVTFGPIRIDRTPPVIVIVTPDPDARLPVGMALEFWAEDASSGVANVVGLLSDGKTVVSVSSGYVPERGHYVLTVEATDTVGNTASESRSFVVTKGRSGYASGSGSFNTPADAYVADPRYTGKAIFSFTCQYTAGDAVPSSRWPFLFQVGSLDFQSTRYDWLDVAGAMAQFRGSGTLNGRDGYDFMVTAVDGEISGDHVDRLRVKIWKADGTIIYDNEPGADDLAIPSTKLRSGCIVVKG